MHLLESIVGKNYINGEWLTSIKQIPVINPSTLKEIGSVPNLALSEINNAIDNTVKDFNRWSQSSFEQRISILRKWHSLILENIEE